MPSNLVINPKASWSEAMFAALADGEWHDIGPVLRAMERAISPQQGAAAYRRYLAARHNGGAPYRVKAQETREQVRDGRRVQARRSLLDWKRQGKVEIDPPERNAPGKRVRLVPDG